MTAALRSGAWARRGAGARGPRAALALALAVLGSLELWLDQSSERVVILVRRGVAALRLLWLHGLLEPLLLEPLDEAGLRPLYWNPRWVSSCLSCLTFMLEAGLFMLIIQV